MPRKWIKIHLVCIFYTWLGLLHILYWIKIHTLGYYEMLPSRPTINIWSWFPISSWVKCYPVWIIDLLISLNNQKHAILLYIVFYWSVTIMLIFTKSVFKWTTKGFLLYLHRFRCYEFTREIMDIRQLENNERIFFIWRSIVANAPLAVTCTVTCSPMPLRNAIKFFSWWR